MALMVVGPIQMVDTALDVARSLGIRVIIPFVDQWTWHGGIEQYSKFRGYTGDSCALVDDFFESDQIRTDFKSMIHKLINRVNTINGIRYKDDPTILAWEVRDAILSIYESGLFDSPGLLLLPLDLDVTADRK